MGDDILFGHSSVPFKSTIQKRNLVDAGGKKAHDKNSIYEYFNCFQLNGMPKQNTNSTKSSAHFVAYICRSMCVKLMWLKWWTGHETNQYFIANVRHWQMQRLIQPLTHFKSSRQQVQTINSRAHSDKHQTTPRCLMLCASMR